MWAMHQHHSDHLLHTLCSIVVVNSDNALNWSSSLEFLSLFVSEVAEVARMK